MEKQSPDPLSAPNVPSAPAQGNDDAPPPYAENEPDPPPAYSEVNPVSNQSVKCRICESNIYPKAGATGSNLPSVLKCNSCNEVTPIRPAAPGRRYVRCPCHALLIADVSSTRIICPRPHCRRTLAVRPLVPVITGAPQTTVVVNRDPNMKKAHCGHCGGLIRFNQLRALSAMCLCPLCGRASSFGPGLKRRRMILFYSIGLFFLLTGIGVTIGTLAASTTTGFYFIWIGAYVVGLANLIRGGMWSCMKVSHIIEENPNA